ncbi:MAG: hypothetical protein EOP45_17220 [Sphingobacteriaceae bacterium]|nr:MAG: hypothetical protein EOP45_17220 [Sphingobacteriaceae bacterium]
MIADWKGIGGPYYLHSDYNLVQILKYCGNRLTKHHRDHAVYLCNLVMRFVEEGPFVDSEERLLSEETRMKLKVAYNDLIKRVPEITNTLHKHVSRHLN